MEDTLIINSNDGPRIILRSELKALRDIFTAVSKRKYQKRPDQKEVIVEEKKAKPNPDWECSGRLWETPQVPCLKQTDRANIKDGIKFEKKRYVICRECKNASNRKKRQEKKLKEKVETPTPTPE